MRHNLTQFDIIGLYGERDYSIKIKDHKLILVGENGSGKTTVFKIMYCALSCDWDALRTFDFEKINIYFSDVDTPVTITLKLLQDISEIDDLARVVDYTTIRLRGKRMFSAGLINSIISFKKKSTENKDEQDTNNLYLDGLLPPRYMRSVISDERVAELWEINNKIENFFDAIILYLPTYRRIEEQLENIFPHMDSEEWNTARKRVKSNRAIELVEFGMEDVEKAVKAYQERLNNFSRAQQNKLTLGYLSEIIEKQYERVDINQIKKLTDEQISDILDRIEADILENHQKNEIRQLLLNQTKHTSDSSFEVREKIICHYFLKLIDFDHEVREEETSMIKFVNTCNKYLVSNELIYNNHDFTCKIYNKIAGIANKNKEIHFQDMSSGEKQIVSLFSHLNLTQKENFFVFIDEPELSLSVTWQKSFLEDILDNTSCIGIIATTHSPFIFDNTLEDYVCGINEFCKMR